MKGDRATGWAGCADLWACLFAIALYAVAPKTPPADGPKQPALYLMTLEWDAQHQDADVDEWLRTPDGKLVFYDSRQVGCVTLDQDNRGAMDSVITLADGTQSKIASAKETIALRCLVPGVYTMGLHLFNYRVNGIGVPYTRHDLNVKVHAEIVALNPYHVVFQKDVVLNTRWQAENLTSFEIKPDGGIALSDAPLDPIVSAAYLNGGRP